MDFQQIINNHLAAERQKTLATSNQLTLGELKLKCEHLLNEHKNKIVLFSDTQYAPTDFDSWRGIYAEIALGYKSSTEADIDLETLYGNIINSIGCSFQGYKGGDFIMNKNTPVWVANYGHSSAFLPDYAYVGIFDVKVIGEFVLLVVGPCES